MCTVDVGGDRVDLEAEPSQRRRRFEMTSEIRGHLAALKRKEAILLQDR